MRPEDSNREDCWRETDWGIFYLFFRTGTRKKKPFPKEGFFLTFSQISPTILPGVEGFLSRNSFATEPESLYSVGCSGEPVRRGNHEADSRSVLFRCPVRRNRAGKRQHRAGPGQRSGRDASPRRPGRCRRGISHGTQHHGTAGCRRDQPAGLPEAKASLI